jgi:glycosyltransferase involved in cell wall biosynthesis
MKLAFVLPALSNKGPIIVVRDIILGLPLDWEVTVFYFDDIVEVDFPNAVKLLRVDSFLTRIDLTHYDVVHSHLLRSDIFCILNKSLCKNMITTMHSDVVKETQFSHGKIIGFFLGHIWANLLRFFNRVIFLTEFQRSNFNFIKNNSVVYNGRPTFNIKDYINTPNSIMEEIKSSHSEKTILGACAHIVKLKGFSQIIDFLKSDTLNEYIFVLVGDGPDLDNLKEYASKKDVLNKCFFIPKTSDVNNFLRYFDIFVMTSYSEGMPLALLEAASHKLPVVCSSIPVITEIFSNEEISYFSLDNSKSLINAVKKIKDSPKVFGTNLHNTFIKHFTSSMMSSKYQEIYTEIVNANNK